MTNKPNNQSAQEVEPIGYLFNGRFYKSLDELRGRTMSEDNQPIALYTLTTSSKSANQSAQGVDVEKFKGGEYYADGKWQTRFLGTYEDFIQAITQSKAAGYSLEFVKAALSEAFKASQEGYQITADEIIQSLTPTPIQTKEFRLEEHIIKFCDGHISGLLWDREKMVIAANKYCQSLTPTPIQTKGREVCENCDGGKIEWCLQCSSCGKEYDAPKITTNPSNKGV